MWDCDAAWESGSSLEHGQHNGSWLQPRPSLHFITAPLNDRCNMPVVQDSDMHQLNSPELYNVWKGQFYIHRRLVCNIELKSSNTCSVPTNLPKKLEIKKVIRLSELRKSLPKNIFEKTNFTGQEVCFERVYCSLFPVTTSNAREVELVKLLNWLKDEDLHDVSLFLDPAVCTELKSFLQLGTLLSVSQKQKVEALIKIINDQGFLILVTPSALQCIKDINQKNSFRLYALFLFPHTKLVVKRESKDCTFTNEDLSLKITNLLPGLQYAISKTRQMQKDKDFKPNAAVELHVKQYAPLQRKNAKTGDIAAESADTSGQSSGYAESTPDKCDHLAFSFLQTYFSSPVNFSVPLVKMSNLLKEDIPKSSNTEGYSKTVIVKDSAALDALLATSKTQSDGISGKSVLHENRKQSSKKKSLRWGNRKSKRKHAHQTPPDKSESPASSKKTKLQDEEPQQAVTPSRTTVKLASAPYPQGRKRGAEVLTLQFVDDDKISITETSILDKKNKLQDTFIRDKIITRKPKEKSPVKEVILRTDRPPKRKASDPAYRYKLPVPETKTSPEIPKRPITTPKEQAGKPVEKTTQASTSSQPVTSFKRPNINLESPTKQLPAPVSESSLMEKRINLYESHALNLLADLALNSFCSSNIPYITSESVAPKSEPLVKEKVHEDSVHAVEYPQNDCSLPVQSSTASQEPSQAVVCNNIPDKNGKESSPLHTTPQQRSDNIEKQTSHKVLIAAAKARARNNATSKISLEHSYSQLPKEDVANKSSKYVNEDSLQKVIEPTLSSPMREQSPDHLFSGECVVQPFDNAKAEPSEEPRAVLKLQDKFQVTFTCDGKYDFELDSKFTNDPLEKTINRALHGPWNPHLKEKVEDVKIILHMWLALFYSSKPSQPIPSTSRKVVEHSNPAKYVSINTVLDPCFEIVESDDSLNSPDTEKSLDPMIKDSENSKQEAEKKESNTNNLPIDLSLSSSKPKKDYNIKLSSEIFQMYNSSSLSALYSDSLQTTVMCKMMPTSKISTPPTNYMNTIPRYIGGSKQVNAELTTKTDKGVEIGGSSSGKASFGESEHRYSKRFVDAETLKSRSTEKCSKLSTKDLASAQDSSAVHNKSVSSENGGTQISSSHDKYEDHKAPPDSQPAASQRFHPLVKKDADVSPSSALDVDSADHKRSELSKLASTTKEQILKNKSALASWMHKENVQTCSEQDETIIQTAKTRIVLKPKIQKINMVPVADKRESEDQVKKNTKKTSNFHLLITDRSRSELVISECSSYVANESKSSGFVACQEDTPSRKNSGLTSLEKFLNSATLTNVKTPDSDRGLQSVCSESSSLQKDDKPSTKELQPSTGNEHQDIKDTNTLVHLELKSNSMKDPKGDSSTHTAILGKWSEETSEELEALSGLKEHSEVVKIAVHEVTASENMSRLELSPSSDDHSDVDDADDAVDYLEPDEKVNMSGAGTEMLQNMHLKTVSSLANSSSEQPVIALPTGPWAIPEEVCDLNKGSITVPFTEQNSEMTQMEQNEEGLVKSQCPPNSSDITVTATAPQLKGIEAAKNKILLSDDLGKKEAPCDRPVALNQEVKHLSAGRPREHTETDLGEEPALTASDSTKFADLEETTLFERLNSESEKEHQTDHSSELAEEHGLQSLVQSKETIPAVDENTSSVESTIKQTELSLSPKVDTLSNIDTGYHLETIAPSTEVLQVCQEVSSDIVLDGDLVSSKHPESSFNETLAELPPKSHASDAIHLNQLPNQLEKSTKDRANRIQNAIRKEIFLKLKRICSGAGQQPSTISEDEVYNFQEVPGNLIIEEPKKAADFETLPVDMSEPELKTESNSKIEGAKTDKGILGENMVPEIPVFAASLTDVEPETLLELDLMTSQSKCLSQDSQELSDLVGQCPIQDKCLSPCSSCLIESTEQNSQSKFPSQDDQDLNDTVGPSQIEDNCQSPSSSSLIGSARQNSVRDKSLLQPISVLADTKDTIKDNFTAPPNVTNDLQCSPIREKSLVSPTIGVIDHLEQVEACVAPPNVLIDKVAEGPVGENNLVPPPVDSSNSGQAVPDKCLTLSDIDLIDHIVQKSLLAPNYLEQDLVHDENTLTHNNSLIDRTEQHNDSAQNKSLTLPNILTGNLKMDSVVECLPPTHDDLTANKENYSFQETLSSTCNVDFLDGIGSNSSPHHDFTNGVDQNPVQDKCLSPAQDEFTDCMEQEEESEICCIVNTGSISKEQYDRWSETSDEDIAFIQAYKEALSGKASTDFQKECLNTQAQQHSMFSKPSLPSPTQLQARHSELEGNSSGHHRDFLSTMRHGNAVVSKNYFGRRVHTESTCAMEPNLDSLFTNRRMVSEDLTQTTIDMEQLRFMCRLKDILRKSSTDINVTEPGFQAMFESKRIPSFSGPKTKCKSPLLITVHCPPRRRDYRDLDSWHPNHSYNQAYYEDELWDRSIYSRTPKKLRHHRSAPYHFHRLRYESTLEKPSGDISVILKECALSNHKNLSSVSSGINTMERTLTCLEPEENHLQIRQAIEPSSSKSQTVGNLISDLCTSLHSRLHGVAKGATKKNLYFYLCEPVDGRDDEDFYSLTKVKRNKSILGIPALDQDVKKNNGKPCQYELLHSVLHYMTGKSLLMKDGHTPMEPQDFCNGDKAESNKLFVVVRNEHVSSHIHKIPCLLQLKLRPDVTFAGVDTPEDVTDSMYQELFQAGGFVVSEKSVLENITMGKLKDILMTLERLNRTSAWKWLIHYGENRKLKEDKRPESISQSRVALLQSYQDLYQNIIEILPYHRCDSRSKEPYHDLECLLSLQSQHIHSRLAVYLTALPYLEVAHFEQNGFLVYDVDTFIRRIKIVDMQLQSSSW
ncbi:protein TASOR 2 [Gastrophryne carolinensis]